MDKRQTEASKQLELLKQKYAEVREDKSVPLTERVKKAEYLHNLMKALEVETQSGPSASDVIDRVSRPKKRREDEEDM